MAIGHHRHVTEDERHFRDVLELRLRLRFDRFRRKKRDYLVVDLVHGANYHLRRGETKGKVSHERSPLFTQLRLIGSAVAAAATAATAATFPALTTAATLATT